MEITGKIIWVGERRSGISQTTGQPWTSQDFTVEAQFNGPTGITIQRVCFSVSGADRLNEYNLRLGDECTVHYGVNAHEYKGKYYNDVRAYKIEKSFVQQAAQQYTQQAQPQQYQQQYQQQYAQQSAAANYGQQTQQPFPPNVDPSTGLPF